MGEALLVVLVVTGFAVLLLFGFKAKPKIKAEISGPRPEDFGTTEKSVHALDRSISDQKLAPLLLVIPAAAALRGTPIGDLLDESWWALGFFVVTVYLVSSPVLQWLSRLSNRKKHRYLDARKAYEAKLGQPENGPQYRRSRTIPKDVKMYVWQRDRGQCVECGSNENLEYDHIIPFSRGGSSTERNLQLLCESCNRQKGASI